MKKSIHVKCLVLLSIFTIACFYPDKIYAQQAGTLDSTFGNNGVVYCESNFVPGESLVSIMDNQDRILTCYRISTGLILKRFYNDGSRDSTFGNLGSIAINDGYNYGVAPFIIQNDSSIVVGSGITHIPDTDWTNGIDFFITKLNENGVLDSTFGNQGQLNIDLGQNEWTQGLAFQSDGKILVSGCTGVDYQWNGGNIDVVLMRILASGTLDSSFGTAGVSITDLSTSGNDIDMGGPMVIQPNGKILMRAENATWSTNIYPFNLSIIRYESGGTLDTSFADNGILIDTINHPTSFPIYPDIALQDNGSIIIAGAEIQGLGFFLKQLAIRQYTSSGLIDGAFGNNGMFLSDTIIGDLSLCSIKIQTDHKIVASGFINDSLLLMRFTPSGSPDLSFASIGKVLYKLDGLKCQSNKVYLIPNDEITIIGNVTNQIDSIKVFNARFYNDILNAIAYELYASKIVSIYPNPANDLLVVSYPLLKNEVVTITITDITGKVIYKTTTINSEKSEVNTSDFAEGMYMVQVRTNNFVETKKGIIAR